MAFARSDSFFFRIGARSFAASAALTFIVPGSAYKDLTMMEKASSLPFVS